MWRREEEEVEVRDWGFAEKAFQCYSVNIQDNRGETQGRQTTCPSPAMDPNFFQPIA